MIRARFAALAIAAVAIAAVPAACGSPDARVPDAGVIPDAAPDAPSPVPHLAFTQQPADTDLGVPLAAFTVSALDDFGEVVPTATGVVHVALAANPSSASLAGVVDVPLISGAARFSGIEVSAAGDGYTLAASAPVAVAPAASLPFEVRAPVSAATSTLVVSPTALDADGVATATVTTTLRSAAGALLAGRPVSVQIGGSGNHLVPAAGTTDTQGRFVAHVASTVAGSKLVNAMSGAVMLTSGVTFDEPPCVLGFPGVPTILQAQVLDLAATDVDGDGIVDLATLETGAITVRFGAGNGRFGFLVRTPVPDDIRGFVAGDFTGDGTPDLALMSATRVDVYAGAGDGTFSATNTSLAVFGTAVRVFAEDLDEDGRLDLLVRTPDDLQVFHALGGSYQALGPYPINGILVGRPSLAFGYVNGDKRLDVIALDEVGAGATLLGAGGGALMPAMLWGLSFASGAVGDFALADFDQDGMLDVVTGGQGGIRYLRGNGEGAFFFTNTIPQGEDSWGAVFARDVDGDGALDILAAGDDGPAVLRGTGTGSFAQRVRYAGDGARFAAAADVNNDGLTDLIMAGDRIPRWSISVALARPDGTFLAPRLDDSRRTDFAPFTADFDGNGSYDFLATTVLDETSIATPGADGELAYGTAISLGDPFVAAGDFDGDTHADAITVTGTQVACWRGGGAALAGPVVTTAPHAIRIAIAAHLDPGPTLDLVTANYLDPWIMVGLGTGTGTFTFATYPIPAWATDVLAADLDGDGDADLVAGTAVLLNAGNGTFTAAGTISPTPPQDGAMSAGDLDGDGALDLVMPSGNGDGAVIVLRGHGDGTFAPGVLYDIGAWQVRTTIADVDGDGHLDIVASSALGIITTTTGAGFAVLRGRGDGTFYPAATYPAGVSKLFAADLDGDGRLDLAGPRSTTDGLVRAYNAGCM